jgi:acyl-CoA dehydrogenase
MAAMDLLPDDRAHELGERLRSFLVDEVLPAEPRYAEQRRALVEAGRPHELPDVVELLKARAREAGLWNLFLPDRSGLSVSQYAPLAELTGWSPDIAPEALNCSAPDTGNMELLHSVGTPEQQQRWLEPLLAGEIRSGFAMTEPDVASSDARNIATTITRDGDEWVVAGHKWWTTGAADPRCKLLIVMGRTDPQAPAHRQQSMVLVPMDAPGVRLVRSTTVFGYQDQHGHGEIVLDDVRVPLANLLGGLGEGFAIAQARLGPGRIHHCMRLVGMAERALSLMVERARTRVAFARPLADQGMLHRQVAEARISIDQARLLVLETARLIDAVGARHAATRIAAIKVAVPRMACRVIDDAIQVHGGVGVSDDVPLAAMYAAARTLRIADGPDEVHLRSVARTELATGGRAGP